MANVTLLFFTFVGYISFLNINVNSQEESYNQLHDAEVSLKINLLKNYSADVLPPHTTKPVVVSLGISINSIKSLNEKTQSLTTEAWLNIQWNDSRFRWNKSDYAGLASTRFAVHKIWQPDIHLYNNADNSMVTQAKTFAVVKADGGVVYIPPVTIVSHCTVDLKYYPHDRHKCNYKYGSWTHDGSHLDLTTHSTELDLSSYLAAGEWVIIESNAARKITQYTCCDEPYVDVTFSVTLQRRSPFYTLVILCPLVATVILMLTSFWISPMLHHRVTLNLFSFLILILILMHLSSKLPAVGNDCPLIMTFCGLLLILSIILTLFNFLYLTILNTKQNDKIPDIIRKVLHRRILNVFCIKSTIHSNVSDNNDAPSAILIDQGESKAVGSTSGSSLNHWVMFFKLIDRITFMFSLIMIIATMPISSV